MAKTGPDIWEKWVILQIYVSIGSKKHLGEWMRRMSQDVARLKEAVASESDPDALEELQNELEAATALNDEFGELIASKARAEAMDRIRIGQERAFREMDARKVRSDPHLMWTPPLSPHSVFASLSADSSFSLIERTFRHM